MVAINPIRYSKMTFGAADVAPITQPIVPAPISSNPIQEKHSYMEQDLYGTSGQDVTMSPEYKKYVHTGHHENHTSSLVRGVLTAAAIGVAGVVVIKKRRAIADFFKNIFKETPKDLKAKNVKKGIRPPEIISLKKFNETIKDAMKKADDDDFTSIALDDFRVLFNKNQNSKVKKESLEKLYDLAKIYTLKDRQAKVTIIMPESMAEQADHIVDMFSKNRVGEVKSSLLDKIEGIQIVNSDRRPLSERASIVADKQVGYGVNAGDARDVAGKWGRNISEFFKNLF